MDRVILKIILLVICVDIFASTESYSLPLSAIPENSEQYKKVFGYEPTQGELRTTRELLLSNEIPVTNLSSLKDFDEQLKSDAKLIILIGHNEDGKFKFPSGEGVEISKLSEKMEAAAILGVFLTCHGAFYTKTPATRFKTSFQDALTLAREIETQFANLNQEEKRNPDMLPLIPINPNLNQSRISSPQFSKPMSSVRCEQVFSNALKGRPDFTKEIKRIIFRAEAKEIVVGSAKFVSALSSASVIYVVLDSED